MDYNISTVMSENLLFKYNENYDTLMLLFADASDNTSYNTVNYLSISEDPFGSASGIVVEDSLLVLTSDSKRIEIGTVGDSETYDSSNDYSVAMNEGSFVYYLVDADDLTKVLPVSINFEVNSDKGYNKYKAKGFDVNDSESLIIEIIRNVFKERPSLRNKYKDLDNYIIKLDDLSSESTMVVTKADSEIMEHKSMLPAIMVSLASSTSQVATLSRLDIPLEDSRLTDVVASRSRKLETATLAVKVCGETASSAFYIATEIRDLLTDNEDFICNIFKLDTLASTKVTASNRIEKDKNVFESSLGVTLTFTKVVTSF